MTLPEEFSGRLRPLRRLVERAGLYRAVSAPSALVGGLLSFGGFATAYYASHDRHQPFSTTQFLIVWLVILGLTIFSSLIFLRRAAVLRGEPFFSGGTVSALLSLAPAFIAAAFLTSIVHRPIQLVLAWLTLYGIALLAAHHFAPRLLILLGAVFFASGCLLLPTWKHLLMPPGHGEPSTLVASGLMAATFGGYHLVYALAVWALGQRDMPTAARK